MGFFNDYLDVSLLVDESRKVKAKNFLKKAKENGNLEDIIASANMFSPISSERYSNFRLKFENVLNLMKKYNIEMDNEVFF